MPLANNLNAATKKALLDVGNELWVMPGDTAGLVSALATAAANATATNPYTIHCATYLYTLDAALEIPSYTTLDGHYSRLKGDASTRVSLIKNTGWDSYTGNHSIAIKNLKLDWNRTGRLSNGTGTENHAAKFYKVQNLRIESCDLYDIPKYGIAPYLCDDVYINDIFCNTISAAIQCVGGGYRHTIENIRGHCDDDMVAYTLSDYQAYTYGTEYKDFRQIVVKNLQSDTSTRAIFKAIGGMVPDAYTNTGIVDNLDGTYTVTTSAAHGYSAGDYARIRGCDLTALNTYWLIDSVTSTTLTFSRATGLGNSTTHGTSNLQYFYKSLLIDGIKGTCTNIPIKLGEGNDDAYDICNTIYDSVTIRDIAGLSYVGSLIQIICDFDSSIENLIIDVGGRVEVSSTQSFIQTSGATAFTIGNFTLKNAEFYGTETNQGTVLNSALLNIGNWFSQNIVCDNLSAYFSQPNGQAVGAHLYFDQFEVKNGNTGVQVRDEIHLHFGGSVRHTGNLNRFAINQHASAAMYAYGNITDVGTDNRSLEDAGQGTINCYGMIRVVAGDVQAAAGTYFIDATTGRHYSWNGTTNAAIN